MSKSPEASAQEGADNSRSLLWFLRTTALFQDQTESILDWAGTQARERHFERGETLHFLDRGNRSIYIVMEGKVKLRSFTETGKEKILDVAGPGDTFGPLDSLLMAGKEQAPLPEGFATEAVALSSGLALHYDFHDFHRLLERRPTVVMNVSRVLGLKQRQFEIRLNRLLFRSSQGKVAGLLAELAQRHGEPTPEGIELSVRLTHQEMASMIGVKRETVSESMAALELDEYISTRGRRICVLKPEELDRVL